MDRQQKKTMQACYVGALGTRAMHALQGYEQAEPTYDKKAYTFSSAYHDSTVKTYSHHPVQPPRPGELPQYYESVELLCSYRKCQ
jgi:hypothetical protein